MDIAQHSRGAVQVMKLPGRLDAAVAADVRAQLRDAVAGGRCRLVLDMSDVGFCDSSGLSVLITAVKAARSDGGDVVLLRLTSPVRLLMELTRLHHVFRIFDDEDAAVAALAR